MLDVLYLSVSAVLLWWHTIFGALTGLSNGIGWALAVAFLVFTVRSLAVRSAIRQARNQCSLVALRPELDALRAKYSADRSRLTTELQAAYRRHGVSPAAGVLTGLTQGVVLLGLYHVLRSFDRTGAPVRLSVAQNLATPNYLFSATDVGSFLQARFAGSPLVASLYSAVTGAGGFGGTGVLQVAAVAVPLMLIAAMATHLTARAALTRQQAVAGAAAHRVMRAMSLWVFPAGALVGGPFLPVAVLVYWVANNAWTLGQQYLVARWIERHSPPAVAGVIDARR